MKFKNRNILLISPEPWDHIFISKHHYAIHLAKKGNKVFFLNPPANFTNCNSTEYENVYSVSYTGFVKGLRFLPNFIQKILIRSKFKELQNLCRTKFDIVWSFDNSVFFDFSVLPKEVFCISHIVDLNQDFEFKKSSETADLCLAVCDPILRNQKQWNSKSYFINHGFNNENDKPEIVSLPGINKLKAFYAGNLDIKYIDWYLIDNLINEFPKVDFVFAGPWINSTVKNRFLKHDNFHHIGIIKSKNLSTFYHNSDMLLIAYKYAEFPKQLSNSHKMMEYLGSGKMIVTTWTEEYSTVAKQGLIRMAKTPKEFISIFNEVKNNLGYWNNNEIMNFRKDFAIKNTYENQIEKIEGLIS